MKFSRRNIAVIIGLICLSAYFHLSTDKITDPDGFYHIKHAQIYRENGVTQNNFPWVKYSAISQHHSDIWYGFHILLIPFTYFSDLATGIKVAGIFLTSLVLIIFFFILKKSGVGYPLFWTILLFFSVPDVHWRLLMVRPHTLTFIFSILLFYFLTRNNRWGILFSALLISFFHLALSWVVFLIVGIVLMSRAFIKIRTGIAPSLYAIAGVMVGWLLRPNPIGAIKLAYVQVVQLMIEKLKGTPVQLGAELRPGSNWTVLIDEIMPILLVILGGVLLWKSYLKKKNNQAILPAQGGLEYHKILVLVSSLILTVTFGLVTIFIARRSMDFFVGFGFIFAGLSFSLHISKIKHLHILLALLFVILTFNTLYFANIYKKQSIASDTFKESALWLKNNSNNQDIVFNIHWDNFPSLFFWNQRNYYINGMDPIFEYAFNKQLYWEHYYLDIDGLAIKNNIGYTCRNIRSECSDRNMVELYNALKNDFKARYIFIEPSRNPKLNRYLEFDKRFRNVFKNNDQESIFEIL